jgi:phosphate transport system permease protein
MAAPPKSAQPAPQRPRPPGVPSSSPWWGDLLLRSLSKLSALSVIALFTLVVAVLIWQSIPAMRALGLRFLVQTHWNPVNDDFGALPFVYGTLATSALAMLIAVPLGVGTAAFMSEVAPPWLRRAGSFLVELLAAIPSVVYGTWGIFVLAPAVARFFVLIGGPETTGSGIFTAGLILAVMIVPYVAAVSYDVCQAVPRAQREASFALGATRWQTIWSVVLPYARSGIVGACFLALGRALGETMAVTMLIGNKAVIDLSLFAQGDTIASRIANQLNEADNELWRSTLVELGLVLVLVTMVVNTLARVLIRRVGHVRRIGIASSRGLRRKPGPMPPPATTTDSKSAHRMQGSRSSRWVNRAMTAVLGLSLFVTIGPLFLILSYLIYEGLGSINWDFFVRLPKPPGESGGGLANALVGSAMLVGIATIGAVPLGILAAIFLAEYRPSRLIPAVRFVGELLNGVPSIIIGTVAYALLVQPLKIQIPWLGMSAYTRGGFSGWAGSFALGIMMIPIVMRTSEESLKLVPSSLRNASYALGATQWQTILKVIVPAALPAIVTGVFLAIARIAGETAPLLLTAFGNQFWPRSPSDPTPSLPVYIYKYSTSAEPDWNRQAWAAALVLLTAVVLLSAGIRLLTGKRVILASRAE